MSDILIAIGETIHFIADVGVLILVAVAIYLAILLTYELYTKPKLEGGRK